MSTFKYICAIYIRINILEEEKDKELMFWIMAGMDVVFIIASIVSLVLMVFLLRASVDKVQKKKKRTPTKIVPVGSDGDDGSGGEQKQKKNVSLSLKSIIICLRLTKGLEVGIILDYLKVTA